MKSPLDLARLKLSTVAPDMPERERERIVSQIARDCSADQIGDLINDALDSEALARKELSYAQHRLSVLTLARVTRNINQRKAHD